jgi:hypothetical protein
MLGPVIRDGLPVMFFWEDTSDEVIRRHMTIEEAFELEAPPPIGFVHAYAVTFSPDVGFNAPHQALCGFEIGADLRLQAARTHPFGSARECPECRAIVGREWGEDAWSST